MAAAALALAGGSRTARAAGVTVFLNRNGGSFTRGRPNDSRTNVTSVPPDGIDAFDLPAWDAPDQEWSDVVTCVQGLFAPFNLQVVDEDPGDAPHVEAVVGGDPTILGLSGSVGGVSPFLSDCSTIDNSIVFIFPDAIGADDSRRVCETIAQEVAHSFGLDHQYLCQDPMTYLTGCGDKTFQFRESVCGEYEPRECKCSHTQNSARLMLERVGRGDSPAMWLSRPEEGDTVGSGFPVTAVFTHAPVALELYVDGLLADAVTPTESGDPFQTIDLYPPDTLRPGTHQVRLVGRFDSASQVENALIDVDTSDQDGVEGGCAVGGGGVGSGWLVLAAMAVAAAGGRRRRAGRIAAVRVWPAPAARRAGSRVAAVLVGLAAVVTGGCTTTVIGNPHGGDDDLAATCQAAPDVSPAVSVVWTPSGGTCTGVLIGSRALVTAAHCVADAIDAGDPVVTLFGGRQYIADNPIYHPGYMPGSGTDPATDDLAILYTTESVQDVTPMVLSGEAPVFGEELTLVGFGDWSPDQIRDPDREAGTAAVTDMGDRTFAYLDSGADDGCLGGLSGGLVLAQGSTDRLIGMVGQDNQVMRLDRYACWIGCAAGTEVPPSSLPAGCVCTEADVRPCNQCGIQSLDATSETWSACQADEADYPCDTGLVCDPNGYCVPPP